MEAPIRLCCMTRHIGPVCPDNTFMCCCCFEKVAVDDAYTMSNGTIVDMCQPCGEKDTK